MASNEAFEAALGPRFHRCDRFTKSGVTKTLAELVGGLDRRFFMKDSKTYTFGTHEDVKVHLMRLMDDVNLRTENFLTVS